MVTVAKKLQIERNGTSRVPYIASVALDVAFEFVSASPSEYLLTIYGSKIVKAFPLIFILALLDRAMLLKFGNQVLSKSTI